MSSNSEEVTPLAPSFSFASGKHGARVRLHPLGGAGKCAASGERARVVAEGELPSLLYGTEDALAKRAALRVFTLLPPEVRREIEEEVGAHGYQPSQIEELRLCRYGCSSICFFGREYPLKLSVTGEMLFAMVKAICHGAPFAHREEMAEGYLTFEDGIRVGVCGLCQYTVGEEIPAVREIHTLTFRMPHFPPMMSDALLPLCESIRMHSKRGCLIVSPPRVGKTTVLRMLCRTFAVGEGAVRVAVVDTRREFTPSDSEGALMDVLSGYRRQEGAMIALRTLSPRLLAMDEIGGEGDIRALCDAMRSGVMLLATAHAQDLADVFSRPLLSRIVDAGIFDTLLTLCRKDGRLRYALCAL